MLVNLNTCIISDTFLKHLLVERGLISPKFDGEIVIYKDPVITWSDVPNDWEEPICPVSGLAQDTILECIYSNGEHDFNYANAWKNHWKQSLRTKYTILQYRIIEVEDTFIDIPIKTKVLSELGVHSNSIIEVIYTGETAENTYKVIGLSKDFTFKAGTNYTNRKYRIIKPFEKN